MKLLNCKMINFGSYSNLSFDFNARGLVLIHGATGAGKSTLPDAVCWGLFGTTAKNMSADEIKSWKNLNALTEVSLTLVNKGQVYRIYRKRGKGANDLFYTTDDGADTRGKDISDTQQLLNASLGFDFDSFVSSSYYHEFNATNSFFIAPAKDRRALLERVANLNLPKRLLTQIIEDKKAARENILGFEATLSFNSGKLEATVNSLSVYDKNIADWNLNRKTTIEKFNKLNEEYEVNKAKKLYELLYNEKQFISNKKSKVAVLSEKITEEKLKLKPNDYYDSAINTLAKKQSTVCIACNQMKNSESILTQIHVLRQSKEDNNKIRYNIDNYNKEIDRLETEASPNLREISRLQIEENPYLDRMNEESSKSNPFFESKERLLLQLNNIKQFITIAKDSLDKNKECLRIIEIKKTILTDLRTRLLERAILSIQNNTNQYLETYFDSEFRVKLNSKLDNIDVEIDKGGYKCSFWQLSKGQRRLLTLCFCLSVLEESSNNSGTRFHTLFLDEPTDGFDTEMKIKSFKLFEALSIKYPSVFVIEHSTELKSLFTNQVEVRLELDESKIYES